MNINKDFGKLNGSDHREMRTPTKEELDAALIGRRQAKASGLSWADFPPIQIQWDELETQMWKMRGEALERIFGLPKEYLDALEDITGARTATQIAMQDQIYRASMRELHDRMSTSTYEQFVNLTKVAARCRRAMLIGKYVHHHKGRAPKRGNPWKP